MSPPPRNVRGRSPRPGDRPKSAPSSANHPPLKTVAPAARILAGAAAYSITDLPPRLAARVTVDRLSGCWRVGGYRDDDGYAYYAGEGAHRAAYKHLVGPIGPGLHLDHVRTRGCAWRDCCNVAHLEPVPPRVNTLRGNSFAAVNYRKTRCGTCGAPLDDLLNTYVAPSGRRNCRRCNAAAVRAWKKRNPGKVRAARKRRHEREHLARTVRPDPIAGLELGRVA